MNQRVYQEEFAGGASLFKTVGSFKLGNREGSKQEIGEDEGRLVVAGDQRQLHQSLQTHRRNRNPRMLYGFLSC